MAILNKVNVLFLNRDEALELVKNIEGEVEDNPESLLTKILSYDVEVVAITDGANGAYVGNKINKLFLPAAKTTVRETVGAGDAFCSGFLANYIETEDIRQALTWGISNSAGVISKIGGAEGLLTKREMRHRGSLLEDQIKIL